MDVPIYRDITVADTGAVLRLAASVFGTEAAVGVSRWLRSSCAATEGQGLPSIMYGAFDNDQLVGIAAAMESPACEHIVGFGELAVLPDYRGRGIAREMVRLRAAWAQAWRPINTVDRILELSCYDALVPYHERHGFRVTIRHRPGISCIMQATAPAVLATINGNL